MTRAVTLANLAIQDLLTVDGDNDRVGIGSTQPTVKLDVAGIVTATAFYGDGSNLEGVASAGLGTALSDGDDAGSVIYFTDTTLGIGSTVVVDPPSTSTVAYTQYQEVSLDEDVDLIVAEGDDFVPDILGLEDGAMRFGITDANASGSGGSSGISNVVEDTSPQLGGNLDLNSKTINGNGNININGTFTGDGSGLTNVSAVGTGIGVSNSGTNVGTAQTINFGTGITISTVSAGLATATVSETFTGVGVSNSGSAVGTAQTINFGAGLSVSSVSGGYVTVTNTVSAGDTADVSTTTLNVTGVSTFSGDITLTGAAANVVFDKSDNALEFADDAKATFGNDADLRIHHDGTNSIIEDPGSGTLKVRAFQIDFEDGNGSDVHAKFNGDGSKEFYHDNSKKFETASDGVRITGIASASTHVSSGIVTYYGDSSYSAAGRWVLGADGTNHYTFTGPGLGHSTLNDPTLYLMRGQTYMFENKMGAHPFRIQSTSNGSTGTQWNVGVTNNDVSNGVLIFEVPFVCPNTLYYQCTAHANMGGVLNIVT